MITDYTKTTKFYQFTNVNPTGREVGDCSIRCIAVALDKKWEEAFDLLATKARKSYCCMDEVEAVSGVLKDNGFTEMKVGVKKGKKRPTLMGLIKEYPSHTIVGQIAGHWATAKNGKVRDLWNSSERSLYKYWIKEES